MPTTIYDASQITNRRMNNAQSGDFLKRIQNYSMPQNGYAASRGIYDQSIINNVKTGTMVDYRKNDGGATLAYNGCPCNSLTSSSPSMYVF